MRLGNILGSYVKAEEALPAGGCALRGLCRLLSASMAAKVSRAHVRLAEGVKPSGAGDLGVAASLERRGRDFGACMASVPVLSAMACSSAVIGLKPNLASFSSCDSSDSAADASERHRGSVRALRRGCRPCGFWRGRHADALKAYSPRGGRSRRLRRRCRRVRRASRAGLRSCGRSDLGNGRSGSSRNVDVIS